MIKVTKTDRIATETPYHPEFISGARNLGGQWDGGNKAWNFDIRDEDNVRGLLIQVYGTDGTVAETVTIRVTVSQDYSWDEDRDSIYILGRQVARAYGRDSGAKIGEGVVFLEGGASSGGSVKNWYTTIKKGSVFEVRDVPRAKAEAFLEDDSGRIGDDADPQTKKLSIQGRAIEVVEIIEEPSQEEALKKEKAAIEERIAAYIERIQEIEENLAAI